MANIRNERGSALLIVFLFAAVLAISLYVEMPSYAFEAKRIKEQLLIDRGQEYAHAVKLYYRKFRAYPANLDALENTNRLRFLRHKFKDPITGEANWRLLHAGAGGMLTDSKVNPIGLNANGQNTTANATSSNNSSNTAANIGFSAPVSPQTPNSTQAPAQVSQQASAAIGLPQRPPEMPINGAAPTQLNSGDQTGATADLVQTPQPADTITAPSVNGLTGAPAGALGAAQIRPGSAPVRFVPGVIGPQQDPNNPMQGVQNLYNNPNPPPPPGTPTGPVPASPGATTVGAAAPGTSAATNASTSTSSGMGVLQSGGIAGVASLAKGGTIKIINEQTDYSLWEFYYDPSKDTALTGQSGVNPLNGVNQQNNNSLTTNSSGFSSSPSSNLQATPTPTQGGALAPTPLPQTPQPQQP